MPDKPKPGAAPLRKLRLTDWSRLFLAELAATSNVSAAARKAGACTSTAYEARRQSAEFNRAWQQALCEGYDLLEMELLRRLREGEIKPAARAKRGVRTYDNAAPPTSPQEGQAWLVAASPTGAWSGQTGKIASFQ